MATSRAPVRAGRADHPGAGALRRAAGVSRLARHSRPWLAGGPASDAVRRHLLPRSLLSRGALPYAFAVPGGWADILVAALALVLLAEARPLNARRGLVGAWNALGLIDILFVVATATRLAVADPDSLRPLLHLPLSLLVTFLVPLIIASHVVLFWRLGRRG